MRNNTTVWAFCLFLIFCLADKGHSEKLIARVTDWQPFYIEENGSWKGLTIETYQALFQEAGVSYLFKNIPWNRALRDMKTEPIIMGHLTLLDERKKHMHFIGPHFNEIIGLAIESSFIKENVKTLDDVVGLCKKSGKKIGYQTGAFYSEEFNGRLKDDPGFSNYFFRGAKNTNTSMKMIAGNHLLGMMDEKVALDYAIKINGFKDRITIYDYEINNTPVYFGVSKTVSQETLKKLKKAHKVLTKNGTYKKLVKKWLAKNYD